MSWWIELAAGVIGAVLIWIAVGYWQARKDKRPPEVVDYMTGDITEQPEPILVRHERASGLRRAFILVAAPTIWIAPTVFFALTGTWFMAGAWPMINFLSIFSMWQASRRYASK